MALSDMEIRNAKPRVGEYEITAGGGLYLRVMPAAQGGGKYWTLRYRVGRRRRKLGLGVYSSGELSGGAGISLKTARELAQKYRERVALGSDPLEEKQRAAEAETVATLFTRWKAETLAFRPRSNGRGYDGRKDGGTEAQYYYDRHLRSIGKRDVASITETDLIAILKRPTLAGKYRATRILFGTIRRLFAYAAANQMIPANPADRIPGVFRGRSAAKRERVLSPDELRELARRLPDSGLPEQYQAAAWLMLTTCCRVGELSKAKWADVDLSRGEWRIPAMNAKNNAEHVIHLSEFTRAQFARIPRTTGSVWVFPGRHPDEPIHVKVISKVLKELSTMEPPKWRARGIISAGRTPGALALAGGDWSAHDLRRTGATLLGELGVPPYVTEKCLNHKLAGVMAVYQRQTLFPERRNAFRMLGEALEAAHRGEAITPDEKGNVVPIWATRAAR